MKRRRPARRRKTNYDLLLYTLVFWVLTGLATLWFVNAKTDFFGQGLGTEVGKQYLAAAFPQVSRSAGIDLRGPANNPAEMTQETSDEMTGDLQIPDADPVLPPDPSLVVDSASNGSPIVLIYHTHATESYQPVTEGNFHSKGLAGTVREVGDVLEASLQAKGIAVIHDETMHDVPSYNKSYSRSIETAQQILKENPSIKIVIDLHRDAAAYTGNQGHTFQYNGTTAAQFALVVGKGNDNVKDLLAFANRINQKANALYPGFSRGIIQKEYRYNQYISDHCLLLELGNNQNNIEEVKRSATYFANALASLLQEQ